MLTINSKDGVNATMGGGNLGENQLATLTFPSGIDLLALIRRTNTTTNANTADDIGIVFVIYEQNTLFPVQNNRRVEDTDNDGIDELIVSSVGSSIVSLSIAGLETGTVLPQPIEIILRLTTFEVHVHVYTAT